MEKIYLYTRYERFWHWFQAFLIIMLIVTGLEVHGSINVFGFFKSVNIHNILGIVWFLSFNFFVFWLFITGEWKQYIPTTKLMYEVAVHYSYGIFLGRSHPYKKSKDHKHNPLQRVTYLILASCLLTFQMISGIMYLLYNFWEIIGIENLDLKLLATLHLVGGFSILLFLIVHLYMITTGHTIFAHLKSMITGWEEVG